MKKGINKFTVMGNCGADPEVRKMPNGKLVANVTLYTSTHWLDKKSGEEKENTERHYVTFYEGLAKIVQDHVTKGKKIHVDGHMKNRKFTDKDNIERYSIDFIVDELQLC